MSALMPMKKSPAAAKDAFVATGVKIISGPRVKAVRFDQDEPELYIKAMFFGSVGTGKTTVVRGLLELGFKVLVVTTDVGGDGLNSVIIPMRTNNTWDKYRGNLRAVDVSGYEEMKSFCVSPETVFPDIYEFDPDFIFWDGMSGWQQVDVSEYVGDMMPTRSSGKDVSEARESGLQFEHQDWGQIRNATIRGIDSFCAMRNKKTNRIWHKIVTCHERIVAKPAGQGGGFTEAKEPLLQGAGGRLALGAFDLVIRTVASSTSFTDEDGGKRKFEYVLQPHQNLAAKVRGFNLPSRMDADPVVLFTILMEQLGLPLPKIKEM